MTLSCPLCSQPFEIDVASLEELQGLESIECPTCSGAVPVSELARVPGSEERALVSAPTGLAAVVARMNRNVRILGVLALLVLGGLAIYLATREAGNTYNTERLIRQEIIRNEFFTRLIASGATTEEELEAVAEIVPYGTGFIGLSGEKYSLNQAHEMAARTASEVLDVSLTATDHRKKLGTWLAGNFPSSLGRTSWVCEDGRERLIDCPDVLPTEALEVPHRVFLSWPKADGWKNLGWSWTIAAQFDEVKSFSKWGLATARVGKLWGILDESGKWVQPPRFDLVEKVSEHGCVRVQVGGKWGLINRRGELAAKPEWEDVQDQINGFTPVKREDKWGYLDSTGALAIPAQWSDAWRFSPDGYAVVTRDSKRGIIDRTGKVIVEPEWDGAINFSKEGLGMVRRGNGWALIDTTGKLLTKPLLETTWSERRWDLGLLPLSHPFGNATVIGMNGKEVMGEPADALQRTRLKVSPADYVDGLAVVNPMRNENGIIDLNGQWVVPLRMGSLRRFAGGFAASEAGGKWGFIDRTGKVVVTQEWKAVQDFSGGLAAVQSEIGWGFIDPTGKIVVKPEWAEVRPFSGGRAAVRRAGLWGFVTAQGSIIAEPSWKAVGDFSEGFASVKVEPTAEQTSRLQGRYQLWSFIASGGNPVFDGRSWMAWGSKPPFFEDGKASSIKNGRSEWVQLDPLGRESPNAWWQKPLTPGLALQEQDRAGNYLNRHGEAGLATMLIASDGTVVMADVSSRTDLMSDYIPYPAPPKYGLIDMTGKVLVPPNWDEARILSPDWVWIRIGAKCGLANKTGRIVIAPQWDELKLLSPDWVRVRIGGKYGLADKTGRIVIAPEWDELAILRVRSGSLAKDGKTILGGGYGTPILSPWVQVRAAGKAVILRTDGTLAIPAALAGAEYVDFFGLNHIVIKQPDPQGGFLLSLYEPATGKKQPFPAAAKLRWNWNTATLGFIWLQHKETLRWHLKGMKGEDYGHSQPELERPEGWGFIEGRGRLHHEGGWYHIGTDGKPISAERWEEAHDFSEGRAAVKRAGKWGFIDLKGALVGGLVYDEVRDFDQGFAAVKQAAKWGLLALNGNLASKMIYEEVRDLDRGLAAVKMDGRWGYVDGQGRQVIEPVWDEAGSFFAWQGEPDEEGTPSLDVAEVKIKGAAALIGRDGALIVDPRPTELTQNGAAYVNDKEQFIVMRKGGIAAVTKRSFPPTPQGHSKLSYEVAVDVSPAFQWQWSDAALKSAFDALAKNEEWSLYSLHRTTTWRLVNETGKAIAEGDWTEPWYDTKVDPFAQGLISARTRDQRYGLIRKDGTVVVAPRFDRIAWVAPGFAAVWSQEEGGLMKADGQWVYRDTDTMRLARFGLKSSTKTESQHRHGLALIEDVPKWGYARLNRIAPTPKAP